MEADQTDETWTRPLNAKCIGFPVVNCGKTPGRIKLKLTFVSGLILFHMCPHFHENRDFRRTRTFDMHSRPGIQAHTFTLVWAWSHLREKSQVKAARILG